LQITKETVGPVLFLSEPILIATVQGGVLRIKRKRIYETWGTIGIVHTKRKKEKIIIRRGGACVNGGGIKGGE